MISAVKRIPSSSTRSRDAHSWLGEWLKRNRVEGLGSSKILQAAASRGLPIVRPLIVCPSITDHAGRRAAHQRHACQQQSDRGSAGFEHRANDNTVCRIKGYFQSFERQEPKAKRPDCYRDCSRNWRGVTPEIRRNARVKCAGSE
jgi:hypothetical protein